MKQSLQLGVCQGITLTPQLQQAIKLLQLSTSDLQQEIQDALDSNMMLEVDDAYTSEATTKIKAEDEITSTRSQTDISHKLPTDSNWCNIFECTQTTWSETLESQQSKAITLIDYLWQQLDLLSISARDYIIATYIIDSVKKDGYMGESIENIFKDLQTQLDNLELNEVEAVLHRVQNFNPTGVVAKDLADCLSMQLKQMSANFPFKEEAMILVKHHLQLLSTHNQVANQRKLLRLLDLNVSQLNQVIAIIKTLNPKPGFKIQSIESAYIVPDIYVVKHKGKWLVSLNPDIAPKLCINKTYARMIKKTDNSKENTSMKKHLQEGNWFIKSLHNRNDTILRVAKSIVEKQVEFFNHGEIAMRPMVLKNIAERLQLHESTISRAVNNKYMHISNSNGTVELKHFFSSHVNTKDGGQCSATAVRAFIKKLVENENSTKPLSDNKISDLLNKKGIKVARRTVAKYREAMTILSSRQRKCLL